MIAIIRIRGMVDIDKDIAETLHRLRLRRKYSCVVLDENKINLGMIKKVRDYIAYGKINEETLEKIIEARGKLIDKNKKIDVKNSAKEILKGKKLKDIGLKSFFRLHPPRGGVKSTKLHYPKGILGNNGEKINDLIMRML